VEEETVVPIKRQNPSGTIFNFTIQPKWYFCTKTKNKKCIDLWSRNCYAKAKNKYYYFISLL